MHVRSDPPFEIHYGYRHQGLRPERPCRGDNALRQRRRRQHRHRTASSRTEPSSSCAFEFGDAPGHDVGFMLRRDSSRANSSLRLGHHGVRPTKPPPARETIDIFPEPCDVNCSAPGALPVRAGSSLPPNQFRKQSGTFSPACDSADFGHQREEVHAQETHAAYHPREPEEGGEALAQRSPARTTARHARIERVLPEAPAHQHPRSATRIASNTVSSG